MDEKKTEDAYTVRWAVTIFVGLVFAAAGAAKLLGEPVFTAWFLEWGIPLEFMRALGLIELICVLALAVPRTAPYAATALCTIGAGAMVVQGWHGQLMEAILPMLLAAGSGILVWGTPGHPVRAKEPTLLPDPAPDRPRRPSQAHVHPLTQQ